MEANNAFNYTCMSNCTMWDSCTHAFFMTHDTSVLEVVKMTNLKT